MMMTLRETGKMPIPSADSTQPPPANPCNLANSVPNGELADALTDAGFTDITAEEWPYEITIAGKSPEDVAARFIEATPFHGDILTEGGEPLLAEAIALLTLIFDEAGHQMCPLAKSSPQWTGIDNPDNLTTGMVFKTNTSLYVTAISS